MTLEIANNFTRLSIRAHQLPFMEENNYIRREHSEKKDEMIADPHVALALLFERSNDSTRRYVRANATRPDNSRGPVVRVEYSRDFRHGKTHDFPLDPQVMSALQNERWIRETPIVTMFIDGEQFKLAEHGVEELWRFLNTQ